MRVWTAACAVVLVACEAIPPAPTPDADVAEAFFRGVYGCDPAAIREYGAEDVAVSYPIFADLFGDPAVRGIEDVVSFSQRFCSRWQNPLVTIHERIAEPGRVVLVWGFEAVSVVAGDSASQASGQRQSWGGISYFAVNDDGRVELELGEESTPGPFGRLDTR